METMKSDILTSIFPTKNIYISILFKQRLSYCIWFKHKIFLHQCLLIMSADWGAQIQSPLCLSPRFFMWKIFFSLIKHWFGDNWQHTKILPFWSDSDLSPNFHFIHVLWPNSLGLVSIQHHENEYSLFINVSVCSIVSYYEKHVSISD